MSRPLRIEYPGAWCHIMNRGRRRENIFLNSSDYQAFVDLLANVSDMFKAQVAAFALMSDHYHLLLCTPEGNINRIMRHVGVYTQGFNRRHGHEASFSAGVTRLFWRMSKSISRALSATSTTTPSRQAWSRTSTNTPGPAITPIYRTAASGTGCTVRQS